MNSSFTINSKRPISKGLGDFWYGLTKNPIPGMVTLIKEESHKSGASPWRIRGCVPYQGPTQPLGPISERWVPKMSGFENQWGSQPGNPKGCKKLRHFSWRSYIQMHLPQGPAQKQQL